VVEESDVCHGHRDVVFIAGLDDIVVADGAASLGDVFHATLVRALDVVAEGEEGVGAESHIGVLGNPLLLLRACERLGLLSEVLLPGTVAEHVVVFLREVDVDAVVAVGAADMVFEGEAENLRALAHPPFVGLAASQACAVDTALLTGTDADGLTVLNIAYGVRLGVFQCDECYLQVADSLRCEGLVLGGHVFEELWVGEVDVVAALLKGDAKDLLVLNGLGDVVGVYLDDAVGTLALLLEDFQSLGSVVGCDDAVADLALDESCCSLVAGVAEGAEVSVGAHAVGTTCTGIGVSKWCELKVDVVDKVYLLQRVAQRQTDGSTGRADMLEAGSGGQAGGSLQLFDKLPAVEGIEEVDVTGTAVDDFHGKVAVLHVDTCGFLVGITTVLKSVFFHFLRL
jgi:hypothetical protein